MITKYRTACAGLLTTAALVGAGSTPASAGEFPAKAQKVFVSKCVEGATSSGDLTKKKARAYCKAALSCLEGKLTLNEFKHSGSKKTKKAIKQCTKQALEEVS